MAIGGSVRDAATTVAGEEVVTERNKMADGDEKDEGCKEVENLLRVGKEAGDTDCLVRIDGRGGWSRGCGGRHFLLRHSETWQGF